MAWQGKAWDWQLKQTKHQLLEIRKKSEDMLLDESANEYDRPHRQEVGSFRNRCQSYEDDSNFWGCDSDGQWRAGGQRWYSSRGPGEATNWRSPRQDSWRTQPPHNPYESSMSLSPLDLVNYLGQFQTFSATFSRILQEKDLEPSVVRQVALRYSDVFLLNGEAVELRPRLSICTAHRSSQGCRNVSCLELHICHRYVLSTCLDSCSLGHRWRTDHNIFIIKNFFLQYLEVPLLRKLVQLVLKLEGTKRPLGVCRAYNTDGCNLADCDDLHLCLSFVLGFAKCSRQDCKRNHYVRSPECSYLFIAHGISVNDAPQDIVYALLSANPAIAHSQGEGSVASREGVCSQPSPTEDAKSRYKDERCEEREGWRERDRERKEMPRKDLYVTPRKQKPDTEKHVDTNSSSDTASGNDCYDSDNGRRVSAAALDNRSDGYRKTEQPSVSWTTVPKRKKKVGSSSKAEN